MAKLAVIGPNLRDQSKGGIHVHAFGCKDTKKAEYHHVAHDVLNAVEINSYAELADYVYPHSDFGWNYEDDFEVSEWLGDVYEFPCVPDLPMRVTQRTGTFADLLLP